MSDARKQFFYKQTSGIRITVRPAYMSKESHPTTGQYVFSYHVRIENISDQSCQLRTRRWLIHDPVEGNKIVEGDGVVGEQPHMLPGQVHEYRSFCVLKSPTGWMEGAYRFVRNDGSSFEADIPRFTLDAGLRPDQQRTDTIS